MICGKPILFKEKMDYPGFCEFHSSKIELCHDFYGELALFFGIILSIGCLLIISHYFPFFVNNTVLYIVVLYFLFIAIIFSIQMYYQAKRGSQLRKAFASQFEFEIRWRGIPNEEWIIKNQDWIDEFQRLSETNLQIPKVTKISIKTQLMIEKFQNWSFRYRYHLQFGLGIIEFIGMYLIGLLFDNWGVF